MCFCHKNAALFELGANSDGKSGFPSSGVFRKDLFGMSFHAYRGKLNPCDSMKS